MAADQVSMDYRYYNYFTEIEEHFIQRRGKHMLVSPLDWSLIESWKQSGIPLHVVFRGIDRAFAKHQARGTQQRVNSVFYCQPSVMECFEEYRLARVGEEKEDGGEARRRRIDGDSRAKLLEALNDLQRQLDATAKTLSDSESVARARRMMAELLQEIEAGKGPPLVDIEDTLQTCDSILLDGAQRALDESRLKQFQKEAKQELKIYKKKVAPEMYARIEQNFIKRKIRQEFKLPEFTLFFLS